MKRQIGDSTMSPYDDKDVEILLCARCEAPLRMKEEAGEAFCECHPTNAPEVWNIPSFEQYADHHSDE